MVGGGERLCRWRIRRRIGEGGGGWARRRGVKTGGGVVVFFSLSLFPSPSIVNVARKLI